MTTTDPHAGLARITPTITDGDTRREGDHGHDRFTVRYGSLELDVPRSIGYFGGLAVAVGLEVIDPPLALFIAAVPFVKMLDLPRMLTPIRFVSHVLQGASKPVGSDPDGVVKIEGNNDE